jgi:hypothetical protein
MQHSMTLNASLTTCSGQEMQLYPTILLCLSRTRTRIVNGVDLLKKRFEVREVVVRFDDIVGMLDYHCLNYLFKM